MATAQEADNTQFSHELEVAKEELTKVRDGFILSMVSYSLFRALLIFWYRLCTILM